MMNFKHAIIEALMSAYVDGWYDKNATTDAGKQASAHMRFRQLMAELGMHEKMEEEHSWGAWCSSITRLGAEFRMCYQCNQMEYRDKQ